MKLWTGHNVCDVAHKPTYCCSSGHIRRVLKRDLSVWKNGSENRSAIAETARIGSMLPVTEYSAKSLKVVWNDTLEYDMCKFLLVFHCKYECILYRFWDIQRQIMARPRNLDSGSFKIIENSTFDRPHTTYNQSAILTMTLSCIISQLKQYIGWKSQFHTPRIRLPRRSIAIPSGMEKVEQCVYPMVKSLMICLAISIEYWRVTDGQTDGRTSCDGIVSAMNSNKRSK